MTLQDVQAEIDQRGVCLHRVGVSNVHYPIVWNDHGHVQASSGCFSLGIALPAQQRGAHLSRFIALLDKAHQSDEGLVISLSSVSELHARMLKSLGATEGELSCRFQAFRQQKAPSSGQDSLSHEEIMLGCDGPAGTSVHLEITVMVTSLCPCSREISKYGAHNQRSLVKVEAQLFKDNPISLKDLAQDIAAEGSCEIYNLLKRSDEKAVTEKAYENAKFSEDVVRDVCLMIQRKYSSVNVQRITSTHLESIHQHDAYSVYQGDL